MPEHQGPDKAIAAVHRISRLLSSTLDLDQRLRDILTVSLEAVDASAGSILFHRPEDDTLVFAHVVGPKAAELSGFAMPAGEGLVGEVFRTGEARITNAPDAAPEHRRDIDATTGFTTENMVTVPLKYAGGAPAGVMQVLNRRGGPFTAADLEVLEIVAAIAEAAIENARLAREAELAAVAHAVGDLGHDLKNKISPITLSVETLAPLLDEAFAAMDRLEPDLSPESAAALRDATDLLRELYPETLDIIRDQVREVQEYTRLIADAVKGIIARPRMEVQDILPALERQVSALEPVARARGVDLILEADGVAAFPFDRFLVERAVYNLVNNAIPETPDGGSVTVRAGVEGEEFVIAVTDTGRGMPAHVLDTVLRGSARSTKPGGTGLGTRIVYNAVSAHRGRFTGESREGSGTTLRLHLPVQQPR